MPLLLDIFGFLSVVLRGVVLAAQSFTLGGVAFLTLVAWPLAKELAAAAGVPKDSGQKLLAQCSLVFLWSACALFIAQTASLALQTATLMGTLDISLGEALGADFARLSLAMLAIATLFALLSRTINKAGAFIRWALPVLAVGFLLVQAHSTHAASRLENQGVLLTAAFCHMAGAALWIGGIPYFIVALKQSDNGTLWRQVGRRFSWICLAAVVLLVASGVLLAWFYVGSLEALYGTAYGVMVCGKIGLLAGLLVLGGMNFLTTEKLRRDATTPILRLRRFAEAEIGIGLTVLFAAASLTSLPPAIDLLHDRATWSEIVERVRPRLPIRLASPDSASLALSQRAQTPAADSSLPQAYIPGEGVFVPRNAADIAWSEYNHHWAGIFVLLMGVLAMLERVRLFAPFARHWPLLLLGLAGFLLLRSDPEVWPLGNVGLLESLRDPEVVQHRFFVLLIIVFGIFEWRVRLKQVKTGWTPLVFPLVSGIGGAFLLTHSHALSNIKEQLLIEVTHVPLALVGIMAAWARWLEIRLEGKASRIAAWVWPVGFILTGIILLLYRES